MRRWMIGIGAFLAAGAAALALAGEAGDLTVHEWGTFLVMQGSDGVTLEGMYHEEHALPAFVHSRGRDQLKVPHALVKGETPVIYFYTPQARRVMARVDFPTGIWTQWYPQASLVAPHLAQTAPPELRQGSITWHAEVLPAAQRGRAGYPEVSADSLWRHARDVDAAWVRTRGEAGPEVDRFLFYRGLGRAPLPLRLTPEGRGTLTLLEGEPLQHLFVLDVRDGRGRFRYLPRLAAGTPLRGVLPDGPAKPLAAFTREVADALAARLAQAGLYEKEARAMVNTWRDSYFQSDGTRVLFLLPRAWTDRTLPLEITPKPREVVRVMVGRLEVLDPAREARAETAVRRLAHGDERAREAAFRFLRGQGRYVEPVVRRVRAATADPAVRRACDRLLLTDFVTDLRTALEAPGERGLVDRPVHVRAQLALLLRDLGDQAAAQRLGEEVLRDLGPLPAPTTRRSPDRHPLRAAARAAEATGDPARGRAAYERYLQWAAQTRSVQDCRACHAHSSGPTHMAWFRDWWAGRRYAALLAGSGDLKGELAALRGRPVRSDADHLRLAYLAERAGEAPAAAGAWQALGVTAQVAAR